MEFVEAIRALIGAPHLVAFRMPGPQLTISRGGMVVDHRGPKPRQFTGVLQDYVAIDWTVMKQADFVAMLHQLAAAAAEQRTQEEVNRALDASEEGK